MVLIWRGWGISVFYSLLFWLIAAIALLIGSGAHDTDAARVAADMQWGIAGIFALTAATVFLLALYRKRHPQMVYDAATQSAEAVPHVDHFFYLRFDLWPYILLAIAAFFAGATLLGISLFE